MPVEPILIKKLLRGDGECSVTSLRALLRVFSVSLIAVLLQGGGERDSEALRPIRHGDLLRTVSPLLVGGGGGGGGVDGVTFRASLESPRRSDSNFRPIRRPHVDSTGKHELLISITGRPTLNKRLRLFSYTVSRVWNGDASHSLTIFRDGILYCVGWVPNHHVSSNPDDKIKAP